MIKKGWGRSVNDPALLSATKKLIYRRKLLSRWKKDKFRNSKPMIDVLNSQLLELQAKKPSLTDKQAERVISKKIDDIISRQEMYWHQRARSNWLSYGDGNTKLFHVAANQRKTRNRILRIKDEESGAWISDKEVIDKTIVNHFQSLFHSSSSRDLSCVASWVECKINDRMNEKLCKPFRIYFSRPCLNWVSLKPRDWMDSLGYFSKKFGVW